VKKFKNDGISVLTCSMIEELQDSDACASHLPPLDK